MPGTSTSLGTFSPRAMEPSLTWRFICWHQAYLNKAAFFQQVQTPLGLAVKAFRLPVVVSLTRKRRITQLITTEGCLHSAPGFQITLSFNFHPLGSLAFTRKGLPEGINRSQLFFQSPFSLVLPDGFPTFEASFLYPDYHVLNPRSKGTSLKFPSALAYSKQFKAILEILCSARVIPIHLLGFLFKS